MNWVEFGLAVVAVIVAVNLSVLALSGAVKKLADVTENKVDDKVASVLAKVAKVLKVLVNLLEKLGFHTPAEKKASE